MTTALPTGHLRMRKTYAGDIEGTVRLHIDEDGTHRMDFDHNLG